MRAATWRSSPMVTCFVCLPLAGWASMCRPDSGRILQLHHSEVRRRERSDGRFRRRNPLKINWGGAHAGIVATPADTRLLSYVRTLLSYVRTLLSYVRTLLSYVRTLLGTLARWSVPAPGPV